MSDLDPLVPPSDAIWFGEAEDPMTKRVVPAKVFERDGFARLVFFPPGGKQRPAEYGEGVRLETVRPEMPRALVRRLSGIWRTKACGLR